MSKPVRMEPGVKLRDGDKMALIPVKFMPDPNEEVLRTHKLFPLSSIGLEKLADGREGYTMFGALSASSGLADILLEIELLADNVIKATEAYEGFIKAGA